MAVQHGTRSCYVKGCRRSECREAHLEYKRNKKAYYRSNETTKVTEGGISYLLSTVPGATHGLPTTYEWYGCRCPECKAAIQEDWRQSKALARN